MNSWDAAACLQESEDGRRCEVDWQRFFAGLGPAPADLKRWAIQCNSDGTFLVDNRGRADDLGWELVIPKANNQQIYGNPLYSFPNAEVRRRADCVWAEMMSWASGKWDPEMQRLAASVSKRATAYNLVVTNAEFRSLALQAPLVAAVIHAECVNDWSAPHVDVTRLTELASLPPLAALTTCRRSLGAELARADSVHVQGFDEWLRTVLPTDDFDISERYPNISVQDLEPIVLKMLTPELVAQMGKTYGADEWYAFHVACRMNLHMAKAILENPAQTLDLMRECFSPEHWAAVNDHRHLYYQALQPTRDVKGAVSLARFGQMLHLHDREADSYVEFPQSPADGLRMGVFRIVQLRNSEMLRGAADVRNRADADINIDFKQETSQGGQMYFNVIDSQGRLVVTLRLNHDYNVIDAEAPGGVPVQEFAATVAAHMRRYISERQLGIG